jgi:hypothetical protein
MSEFGGEPENIYSHGVFRILTQGGNGACIAAPENDCVTGYSNNSSTLASSVGGTVSVGSSAVLRSRGSIQSMFGQAISAVQPGPAEILKPRPLVCRVLSER